MTAARARMPAAVVIGLDSITGLQTARLLARRGIPVVGLARNPRHPSCRTRACERMVFASTGGEALAECLERLASDFAGPPVLFPCTDLSVLAVSEYRQRLSAAYRSVLPSPGVIELLLDKARFQAYATEAHLPIPRTLLLHDRADADRAAATLAFPCALKPAVKTARWQAHTTAKVFTAATPAELLVHYERCRSWTDLLIAQEWVDGPDACHVTCNAYFDRRSNAHVTFVSHKLRQWPLEGGVGCLSEECRNETVLQETIRLFRGVGHRGLAYLEMKADARRQRYVIIEPNVGRPTGRSAAADRAGIDLLYTQYCDALGWPLPSARAQCYSTRKWIYVRQDLQSAVQHARRGTLTAGGWLQSVRGCRHDAVFSWRDPAPFFADVCTALGKALGRPASPEAGRRAVPPADGVDFDLQGVVGVRLVGATRFDAAAVARQLGVSPSPLNGLPDILVRFADELDVDGLRWLEFGRTGHTDDAFYVLDGGTHRALVKMPLDRVGGTCEMLCRRGLRSIPFLKAIVNLTAVQRGCVPLHASAFVHDGAGVVVTGWARGGKTGALLAFAAAGAEYVGDDWILLDAGGRVLGVPETLCVQAWHLDQLPHLRQTIPLARRGLFAGVRSLGRLGRQLRINRLARLLPRKTSAAFPALKRRLNATVQPPEAFRVRAGRSACLDRVFFMVSHDAPTISIDRADPVDVAGRMAASVSHEQLPLMSAYFAYLGAFPNRRNCLIEEAGAVQTARLHRMLAGKDTYIIRHPYPCNLQDLFQAMAHCRSAAPTSVLPTRQQPLVPSTVTAEVGDG